MKYDTYQLALTVSFHILIGFFALKTVLKQPQTPNERLLKWHNKMPKGGFAPTESVHPQNRYFGPHEHVFAFKILENEYLHVFYPYQIKTGQKYCESQFPAYK